MIAKRWTSRHEGTRGRHMRLKLWRIEVGYHAYRHTYPLSSDRLVFQPYAIYDRKDAA